MKKILSLVLIFAFGVFPIYQISAENGYTVIREPVYNMADSFYSNVTKVSKDTLWGICDTNGYPLTSYKWEAMGQITDEYIPAKLGGLWGYISYEGEVLIPYQFQKAENFSDGFARVLTADNRYAYINRSGEIALISPFDYSFAVSEGLICGVKDGKYGYCDIYGNIVIPPQFDMGFDFHDGLASVKSGESWGYITASGAYAVKPTYNYASDFSGGFAVCSLSTGYGICNTEGKRVSPFTFDYIGACDSEGRFPAKKGDVCGYINSSGDWFMQLDYDFCYSFTDGVARVFKDNLWGYINESGKEIVPPSFADCGEFKNGLAFYSVDGIKYGFLTLDKNAEINDNTAEITPTNPAQENTNEPKQDDTVGTYEEIIDVADIENIPTIPAIDKCISMKIGSKYALKADTAKRLSSYPALVNGVTMVPLRDVVEYMGGTVSWDEDAQRIKIKYNRNIILITVDSKVAFVNGLASAMSAAPLLIDGVTMIPVRSIATSLGCDVSWIPETQNINIEY